MKYAFPFSVVTSRLYFVRSLAAFFSPLVTQGARAKSDFVAPLVSSFLGLGYSVLLEHRQNFRLTHSLIQLLTLINSLGVF